MARKPGSNWSEDRTPEEIADAVARWIAEGGAGPSPVQQLEDAAGDAASDAPELSDSLLEWLSEGTEPSEDSAPATNPAFAETIDPDQEEAGRSVEAEPSENDTAETSSEYPPDVISMPTLPGGPSVPPPPPEFLVSDSVGEIDKALEDFTPPTEPHHETTDESSEPVIEDAVESGPAHPDRQTGEIAR